MKHLFFIAMAIACCAGAAAQNYDDIYATPKDVAASDSIAASKQVKKQARQRLELKLDTLQSAKAAKAVEQRYWVLMANRVSVGHKGGSHSGLDGNANYVLVQGNAGIVQIASNNGFSGFNGMGGITLEGNIDNFSTKTNKKGDTFINYRLRGDNVTAEVRVTLYAGSNEAYACVDGTFSSSRIELWGKIVPYIYKR